MRHLVLALMVTAALAGTATATTKATSTLITPPAACVSGACGNGKGRQCAANADCRAGGLSTSSKWSVDGKLLLKATLKSVTLADGITPAATDQVLGTADDYIFALCLRAFLPDPVDACVYTHVELRGGTGRVAFDAGSLGSYFPAGTVIEVRRVALMAPPADPASCRGDNDTSNPQVYFANQVGVPTKPACEDGGAVAVGGVQNQLTP